MFPAARPRITVDFGSPDANFRDMADPKIDATARTSAPDVKPTNILKAKPNRALPMDWQALGEQVERQFPRTLARLGE